MAMRGWRLIGIIACHRTFGAVSMRELTNPRYEPFAQELAAGNTADGYRRHRGKAARLSAKEHVKNRVLEIQAVGAEYAAVTVKALLTRPSRLGSRLRSRLLAPLPP
jgi:hypothetical protein